MYRLNVSFEEFTLISESGHAKARVETKANIATILRKRDSREIKKIIEKMISYYDKFDDIYFIHIACIAKANLALSESNFVFHAALDKLKPVSDYLSSVEIWFDYEISLFINCIYLYPLEKSIKIGEKALEKIKQNNALHNNEDLLTSLLLNLALYALSDEKYHSHAYNYTKQALNLLQSSEILYNSILAKIIHQAICYKLGNSEYDKAYLSDLLNGLKLMKFDNVYDEFANFLDMHDVSFDKI